ncbi:MAG: hypothetical protein NTX06_00260 [Proteobacteria bacterium]|nr:hypothetical protein [Pseudomonadota bacterium]
MLRIMVVIALAILIETSCSDDKNPVREYGSTLTGAVKKAERAKVLADMVTIKAEIMRYKAERGDFPPSLQALNMREIYPDLYRYNPETGEVSVAQ